jgi:hypothetical protein
MWNLCQGEKNKITRSAVSWRNRGIEPISQMEKKNQKKGSDSYKIM